MDRMFIKNAHVIDPFTGVDGMRDILISGGKFESITECGKEPAPEGALVIDAGGKIAAPGLTDPHVHFRDPGFTYKEDIMTGARAAARGGFTQVVMMGNTEPHMDTQKTIQDVIRRGEQTGLKVHACGNVTKGMMGKELTDFDELSGAGAVLFTDDGKPITDLRLMERACRQAARLNMVISLHEEDPSFITDNGINAGEVSKSMGLEGSPRQAEISMVKRDIDIARKTGATIVVQHISAAESVDLIRDARAEGVQIHAEATPHHFTLTEDAVKTHGTLAKMNPPLRLESDRQAIIRGLADGTIDMIATDHAPHSKEEKERPFREAPSGITGLETALSLGIRELVNKGYLDLMTLLERMSAGACRLYGFSGGIREGESADLIIFDPDEEYVFDKSFSKSENTPFLGERLPGVIYCTICSGKAVYKNERGFTL